MFNRIFAALAATGGKALLSEVEGPDQLMIDATHLKAHRTAASLLKKGMFPDVSGGPKPVLSEVEGAARTPSCMPSAMVREDR